MRVLTLFVSSVVNVLSDDNKRPSLLILHHLSYIDLLSVDPGQPTISQLHLITHLATYQYLQQSTVSKSILFVFERFNSLIAISVATSKPAERYQSKKSKATIITRMKNRKTRRYGIFSKIRPKKVSVPIIFPGTDATTRKDGMISEARRDFDSLAEPNSPSAFALRAYFCHLVLRCSDSNQCRSYYPKCRVSFLLPSGSFALLAAYCPYALTNKARSCHHQRQ